METVHELLNGHPFLAGLTPDESAELARHASVVSLRAGTRLFDEGGPAQRFWLIRTGMVRLDTLVPGRGPVVLETLGNDTVLGWSWLFPPYQWHFGAEAVTDTTAVELDGPAVREVCERLPVVGHKLMTGFLQVVIDRLQNTRIRLLDLYGGGVS
jgi:CRP-like cAMP-binding protein